MTGRRAVIRLLAAIGVGVGVVLATAVAGLEPDPRVVLLLAAAGGVSLGLLNDASSQVGGVRWFPAPVHPSLTRGRDAVTLSHARQIENHVTSRRPDDEVRERLATLADQVLRTRHGVSLSSPQGERLLGREVSKLLTGRVRRLSLGTIEQCLRTIEEL